MGIPGLTPGRGSVGYRATAKYSPTIQTDLATLCFTWRPANPRGHEGSLLQVLSQSYSPTLQPGAGCP